jgi:hypothetical protein
MALVEAMADAAPLRTRARLEEYTTEKGLVLVPPNMEACC